MSIVYDLACLELVKNKLMTAEEVVVDTETTGLDVWKSDRLCGIGFCFPDEQTFYLPYRHHEGISSIPGIMSALNDESVNLPLNSLPELLNVLRDVPKLIGHNIKFDLAVMSRDGFVIGDDQELEDTIVGARLYFPEKHADLSLGNCCNVLLGSQEGKYKETFEEYLRLNGWQHEYHKGSPERVGEYCKEDTLSTYRLRNRLVSYIDSTGQRRIWDQESKLLKVLWKMELTGLFYDREYCKDRIPKIDARVSEIEKLVWTLCGEEFNLGSSDQITEVFTRMGIKPVSFTTGGASGKPKPKWDVASLMSIDHPACGGILEYRGLQKVKTTYFEPLLEYEDSIVHPTFKSWGTVTGRMSSTNPNAQNISNKFQRLEGSEASPEAMKAVQAFLGARSGEVVNMEKKGGGTAGGLSLASIMALSDKYVETDSSMAVRRLYIPRPGNKLYFVDFSQMEMRVFADYVGDTDLHALLEDPNFDFHTHVARTVWNVDEKNNLWNFYRTLAKAINFGLIYGIGTKKLA